MNVQNKISMGELHSPCSPLSFHIVPQNILNTRIGEYFWNKWAMSILDVFCHIGMNAAQRSGVSNVHFELGRLWFGS